MIKYLKGDLMRELMEDYGLALFYSIMGMAGVLGFVYLILEVSV